MPAARAGSELTVTVVDASVTAWVGTDVKFAVTVPEIAPIVTLGVPKTLTEPVTVVLPDESTRMALRFVPSLPP